MSSEGFERPPLKWGIDLKVSAPRPRSVLEHGSDAIVVLAGGIQDNFEVHPWVAARLDAAAMAYRHRPLPVICLGGGTYHKPTMLNEHGRVVHECTACAKYLVSAGVDAQHIYKEWASYDTIANGLFAFQHFLVPLKIRSALVITSKFHMPRTRMIFEHMRDLHKDVHYCALEFYSTQDRMQADILNVRVQREALSEAKYSRDVRARYTTISDFLLWLYTKHACYNTLPYNDAVQQEVAESY